MKFTFQISAVGITLTSAIGCGYTQGFSITAAVAFTDPNITTLDRPLDEEEISWISKNNRPYFLTNFSSFLEISIHFNSFLVSIPFISTMIFSISGGSIAEWIGRKRTLIIGQICMMSGWIVLYFARNFQIALIGRFIIG